MTTDARQAELRNVPTDAVERNPDNPRIIFRPGELEDLLVSIQKYGVQVPISVYKQGKRFVLIDGERRWRCCLKLNQRTIPALVQERPSPLDNLLLMFNIHALREQWDYLTIAMKLPRVVELLRKERGKPPTERELSEHTGLRRGVIRRCKLLMELPDEYKQEILAELRKPKAEQRLTEDFFIEMERALKTVENAMPAAMPDKDVARHVLIDKFREGVIPNRVHFRQLARIARAENVAADKASALHAIERVFDRNRYSIERAYADSVSEAYVERDLLTRVNTLTEQLEEVEPAQLDDEVRAALRKLIEKMQQLLETL